MSVLEKLFKGSEERIMYGVNKALNTMPRFDQQAKEWLSSKEVMELLNCKPGQLQVYRDARHFKLSKLGPKTILYERESVLRFIESRVES